MLKKIYTVLISTILFFIVTLARADELPASLIALSSPTGNILFSRAYSASYFWPLTLQFTTQQNLAYCSIASSVMVLNALKIIPPTDTVYAPFKIFTQDNFFTPEVEKVLPQALVKKQGASLDQISQALATYPVSVKTIHADKITVDQFRTLAQQTFNNNNGYIIVNFFRPGLGELGLGHMSPLAAYDKTSDRFLMLDVARYRYDSAWVKTQDLWNAMHTIDKDFNTYRGFVIVSKK